MPEHEKSAPSKVGYHGTPPLSEAGRSAQSEAPTSSLSSADRIIERARFRSIPENPYFVSSDPIRAALAALAILAERIKPEYESASNEAAPAHEFDLKQIQQLRAELTGGSDHGS